MSGPLWAAAGHAGRRANRRLRRRGQLADFRLAVATVAAEGADARELACFGPASHGLGVDTEQRGDLRRGEQRLRAGADWTVRLADMVATPHLELPLETGLSRRS